MTNLYKIFSLCLFCASPYLGNAQNIKPSVISSTGGTISNSNNILTWTLGETVIQNIQSSNNYLSQGFQQPQYAITSVHENISSFFYVKIFPNPSADILNININSEKEIPVQILLIDIDGKVVFQRNENTSAKQHSFIYDTKNFATAMYFLKITSDEQKISETFKIQKVH